MRCPCNILRTCVVFDSEHRGCDHLTSVRANDVHTKNEVRLLLHDELHDALHVHVRLRARVRNEWEFTDAILDASCLEFLFVLAYPCDFRMRVHNGRNCTVVHVPMTRLEVLGDGDT